MHNKSKSLVYTALKDIFGFTDFRPNQEDIITALQEQKDVFAVMPTGGGKSLCYQLPAYLLPGTCLVVSPLISLMKDQVDAACENGLKAAYLNSSMHEREKSAVIDQLAAGMLDLIYVAPERFAMNSFINLLKNITLSFVAIDEAHCISEWGHDFRPDYLSLSILAEQFSQVPIAAFTATATHKVQHDIITRLRLRTPFTVRASFNRPNLFYQVQQREDTYSQIYAMVTKHQGKAGIIYRTTRKNVDETAAWLQSKGISARPYHAGLPDAVKKENQEAFNKDEIEVMVATIAFGMGIDKSNVRFVLHADLPKNMEGYYQETGRAGRDGEPAECLLLFSYGDISKIRYFIDPIEDDAARQQALDNLHAMVTYASVNVCRRKALLGYFDETYVKDNCETCDICTGDVEKIDATVAAQKILATIARTGSRFGAGHIVDILMGAKTKRIRQCGHASVTTYGIGHDKDKNYWRRIINDLVAQNMVDKTPGKYPVLCLNEQSHHILQGALVFYSLHRTEAVVARISRGGRGARGGLLFEQLRTLRLTLARAKNVPPFVVFSDKTLQEMATKQPVTQANMLRISGVGEKKLQQYGDDFIACIGDFVGAQPSQNTVPSPPATAQKTKGSSQRKTCELLLQGILPTEIAAERHLTLGTVYTHIEQLFLQGDIPSLDAYIDASTKEFIIARFNASATGTLGEVVKGEEDTISYTQARLVRAWMSCNTPLE